MKDEYISISIAAFSIKVEYVRQFHFDYNINTFAH